MTADTNAPVISVKIPEAVRITGISRSRLYELIKKGDLEIVKIGRATLIKTDSLRDLIERRATYFQCRLSQSSDRPDTRLLGEPD